MHNQLAIDQESQAGGIRHSTPSDGHSDQDVHEMTIEPPKIEIWKQYYDNFDASPDRTPNNSASNNSPLIQINPMTDRECHMTYCNQPAIHFCHVSKPFVLMGDVGCRNYICELHLARVVKTNKKRPSYFLCKNCNEEYEMKSRVCKVLSCCALIFLTIVFFIGLAIGLSLRK